MFVSQLRRSAFAFSRFKRPIFRNVQNPNELLLDTQHLIRQMKIDNANRQAYQQQAHVSVFDSFKLSRQILETTETKELKVSYFDQNNKQYTGTLDFKKNLKLDVDAVDLPASSKINLKRHFTIDRGVLNIKETVLTELQLGLVNLPNDATSKSIQQFIKPITTEFDISISYCAIGLPAYATLTFKNVQQLAKVKELVEQTFKYGDDKQVVVKTFQNNERQQIKNRRVAINGIQQGINPVNLLTELSKFGRVIHLDFPQIIRNNASKQEIYAQFKNASQPIKIRSQFQNGHVQQQYYPIVKKPEHSASFQQTLYQGTQFQNEQYAQRLQYADTITIYPDSSQKILKSNRGYCLVLFNTTQQAQNCYFQMQQDYQIDLVQDHEFNYDKLLKQELFRYIDNEAIRRQAATVTKLDNPNTRPKDYDNEMIKDLHTKLDDLAELRLYEASSNLELYDVDRFFDEDIKDTQEQSQEYHNEEEQVLEDEEGQGEVAAEEGQVAEGEQAVQVQDQDQKYKALKQRFPYSIANQATILRDLAEDLQHEQDYKYQDTELSFEHDPQAQRDSQDNQPESLLDRILQKKYSKQKLESNKRTLNNLKINKKVQQVGRTFSELAELELFGTIIPPKKVSKKKQSDIAFEYDPQLQNKMKDLYDASKYQIDQIEEAYEQIDNSLTANQDYHLNRQIKKIERYMKNHDGQLPPDKYEQNSEDEGQYVGEEGQQAQNQADHDQDGNNTPSAKFSTMRQQALYRKATQKQRQSQLIAYNLMIKKLINEYFGRFDVEKLRNTRKSYELPTINLRQLKFSDGQDFLTEDDLPKILNFHYDQQDAFSTFTQYYKIQEAFKSLPIGQRQKILALKKQNQNQIALKLTDIGVVEQIYQAQSQQVVDQLNLYESKLGQSYELIKKDGEQFMVKIIKNQPLFPIQQLNKLQNSIQQPFSAQSQNLTQILQQAQNSSLFQALSKHGISPQQIQQMLQQIVANTHTPLKVLQAIMHLKDTQTFQADIETQLQLQKLRLIKTPLSAQNMIKSPDLNQQLENRGKSKFAVSEYRQL